MFNSSSPTTISLLKNTEALISRFKRLMNETDSEDAVIELESGQNDQSLTDDLDEKINSVEEDDSESPFASPSESLTSVPQIHTVDKIGEPQMIKAQDSLENLDLTSFEVVQAGEGFENSKQTKEDSAQPESQNNGFGDAGNTTLNIYKLEDKKTSTVKSIFSSFLEENGDGCIVPFTATPPFQKEAIIIGDIVSTAVQGFKAGVSYLLGEKNNYREDIVHYRGYKLRTKGVELFLDSVHAKNHCKPDEMSTVSERKVPFQFKLSNSSLFWQNKDKKKIVSLPLKVYWADHINSTSMFVEVFDSEIELEMPISISKDSIVVSCDPDLGTLYILAPSHDLPCTEY